MAQRLKYFLVVLLLMLFTGEILAQTSCGDSSVISVSLLLDKNVSSGITIEQLMTRKKIISNENDKYIKSTRFVSLCNTEAKNYYAATEISPSIYFNLFKAPSYKPVALFCIAEDRFEKQTSIPLRLRVGSLDHTNYLEQKPNAVKPAY